MEKAVDRNLIVYLRTGTGKTYIAVMLLKEKSDEILKPYSDPKCKRSIFLANTVPLVKQQAKYLERNTQFKVGTYFGDQKIDGKYVDFWENEIWQKELERNHIFVMSPQILVDCLHKNFIGNLF